MGWHRRDLLAARGLGGDEIRALLTRAGELDGVADARTLAGRSVGVVFFEDSTRTRTSFDLAARRLGADVVHVSGSGSSVSKGETLLDSARTLAAMGIDALVVRCGVSGGAAAVARAVTCPVLNAGDGRHEHPTQALADAMALSHRLGRAGSFDLSGMRVVIVGDVASSRVARSGAACLTALGAEVTLVGPPTLAPGSLRGLGCRVVHDLDGELEDADAVMALRIQFERHGGTAIGSAREYREGWGLTEARAARMKAGALVLHPGPMNRGIEIDGAVADGARSIVLEQVRWGVPARAAALEACIAVSGRAASGGARGVPGAGATL